MKHFENETTERAEYCDWFNDMREQIKNGTAPLEIRIIANVVKYLANNEDERIIALNLRSRSGLYTTLRCGNLYYITKGVMMELHPNNSHFWGAPDMIGEYILPYLRVMKENDPGDWILRHVLERYDEDDDEDELECDEEETE